METKLIYLILSGWFLMLALPSILPAFILAAGMGGAAAYLVFLGNGGEGDLVRVVSVSARWQLSRFSWHGRLANSAGGS